MNVVDRLVRFLDIRSTSTSNQTHKTPLASIANFTEIDLLKLPLTTLDLGYNGFVSSSSNDWIDVINGWSHRVQTICASARQQIPTPDTTRLRIVPAEPREYQRQGESENVNEHSRPY